MLRYILLVSTHGGRVTTCESFPSLELAMWEKGLVDKWANARIVPVHRKLTKLVPGAVLDVEVEPAEEENPLSWLYEDPEDL